MNVLFVVILTLFNCEGTNRVSQLKWWGLLSWTLALAARGCGKAVDLASEHKLLFINAPYPSPSTFFPF